MNRYLSNNGKEFMDAFLWDGTLECIHSNVPKKDWRMFHIAKNGQLKIINKPDITVYANKNELIMRVLQSYYFDAPANLLKKYHQIHNDQSDKSRTKFHKQSSHHPRSVHHIRQESLF